MANILGYSGKGMISCLENDSAEMSYDKLMILLSRFGESNKIYTSCDINNKKAISFYQNNGFTLTSDYRWRDSVKKKFGRGGRTMNEKYEVVKFEQDNLILDVNVSPNEDTVWLSKEDMSILFDRDRSVISRHIKKIFEEKELEEKSNVHFLHIAHSDKPVPFYSLDVVISVGYRVKSHNGIIFRRWANSVLRDYLLKGYAINNNRTLITDDNYIELVHRVNNIDNRLSKIEFDNNLDNEKVFFDGQWFDARNFIKDIVTAAKEEVILIDPYADIKALDYLKIKVKGVRIQLFISSKAKLTQGDINDFNKQYGSLEVKIEDSFHDRFIIVDGAILYHLGASLNYIGKKVFAITKLEDENILFSLKNKLNIQ